MTSTTIDPDLLPRREPRPEATPYEQGRTDRVAGISLANPPYVAMGSAQKWQEGWLYQDQRIEEIKAEMRKAAAELQQKGEDQ